MELLVCLSRPAIISRNPGTSHEHVNLQQRIDKETSDLEPIERHNHTGSMDDLEQAITHAQEALTKALIDHSDRLNL